MELLKTNKHEKIKVIWRFTDGKAGHDKQSLALVESLKNKAKCKIFDIDVQSQTNPILNLIFVLKHLILRLLQQLL